MSRISLRAKALFLFLAVGALYFFTRSPGLDEWDSVQFAMGVIDFNLWKNQPHPPGYPLYIFCGWIGHRLFGWDPNLSLHVASCIGGALFVGAWFLIVRSHFSERFAWLIAVALAITPVVWMTSTKVLTDSLAAGLLSVALYFSLVYSSSGQRGSLLWASTFGAATIAARPQLILVVIVIAALSLVRRRACAKVWLLAGAVFMATSLVWLAPVCYTQAHLVGGETQGWLAYPAQIYRQWHWRLDRPDVFIGAGRITPSYLILRFVTHILGWFGIGFGFLYSKYALAIGAVVTIGGVILTFRHIRAEDRHFWQIHWSWSATNVAIVFCCLPADQRYYLIIMPLLLVALLRGVAQLRTPWRFASLLLPALLLSISIPCAIANHAEDAPPVRAVHFLQNKFRPADRGQVFLFLTHSQRHFEWYGPEFTIMVNRPLSDLHPEQLTHAKAIYTEDPNFKLPSDWRSIPVADFHRSPVIYRKHHDVQLFRIEHKATL